MKGRFAGWPITRRTEVVGRQLFMVCGSASSSFGASSYEQQTELVT